MYSMRMEPISLFSFLAQGDYCKLILFPFFLEKIDTYRTLSFIFQKLGGDNRSWGESKGT